MPEVSPSKKGVTPDWLVRGILTKLGDTFDRLTGRGWKPSSSLATSELIERLKALMDSEAETNEKGVFVPHNIKLKMQWDKFSTDSEESLRKLENELLAAAVDHINDKRYYTYQPLSIEVKPDYFTSGVKLLVSFDRFKDDSDEASINIMPGVEASAESAPDDNRRPNKFILHIVANSSRRDLPVTFHGQERKSVGRTKENDIAIDDSSVSKLHASLMVDPNDCLIVADTGSTNGTFVNGRRIAYGKAVVLTTADKVKFGSVEVTFEPVDSGHPESIAPPTVAMVNNEVPGIPPEPEQPLPTVDQIDLDLGSGTGTKKS